MGDNDYMENAIAFVTDLRVVYPRTPWSEVRDLMKDRWDRETIELAIDVRKDRETSAANALAHLDDLSDERPDWVPPPDVDPEITSRMRQ